MSPDRLHIIDTDTIALLRMEERGCLKDSVSNIILTCIEKLGKNANIPLALKVERNLHERIDRGELTYEPDHIFLAEILNKRNPIYLEGMFKDYPSTMF